MNRIIKNLYLTGWSASVDEEELVKNNIKCIIGLTTFSKSPQTLNLYKKLGIAYLHITVPDHPITNLHQYFSITNNLIYKCISEGKNVLIHCMMGVSRSTTIVLAYMMKIYYMKHRQLCNCNDTSILPKLIEYVRSKRPVINPNPGFVIQLKQYEKNLMIANCLHSTE